MKSLLEVNQANISLVVLDRRKNFEQEKLEEDLIFTLSFFSPIATKDKYTGWQMSHPPPQRPTRDKKLENV